jgi:hypothetical protein
VQQGPSYNNDGMPPPSPRKAKMPPKWSDFLSCCQTSSLQTILMKEMHARWQQQGLLDNPNNTAASRQVGNNRQHRPGHSLTWLTNAIPYLWGRRELPGVGCAHSYGWDGEEAAGEGRR